MSESISQTTNGKPQAQRDASESRTASRRWWIKLFVQPLLLVAGIALLLTGLGVAQHYGWLTADNGHSPDNANAANDTLYICPMMCTPPLSAPGRCPVCGMELVPSKSGGGNSDPLAVRIDPADRRVANIQTVAVEPMTVTRTIETIGELRYDEGGMKTIAAYVDGRIEKLYADNTGMEVEQDARLALIYSPKLYSSQYEFLLAKKSREGTRNSTLKRVAESNKELYESAKQRLIELGMTVEQVAELEQTGEANSRLHLFAPISGTVIEKPAVEGQYIKEGQTIYKLADLSTVWLMLELYPEDAATVHYGQKVTARVQSLPQRDFSGRVAFVDPNVNPKTRTVGVRVVMPNPRGALRVGDFAKAALTVEEGVLVDDGEGELFDAELAGKYISPRHPHIIRDEPGTCPISGADLVPTSKYGYRDTPVIKQALVAPRNAVLMAGSHSVVYVETEPGRFEIRPVTLGPGFEDKIVLHSGVKAGDQVATHGNFLIDSQMQLAGNPSLIDPTKAVPQSIAPPLEQPFSPKALEAIAKLSPADQELAKQQRVCPVADFMLGEMGKPIKVDVNGTPVLICCEGCRADLLQEPQKFLDRLAQRQNSRENSGDAASILPPIGEIQPLAPQGGPSVPPIGEMEMLPEAPAKTQPSSQPQAAP